MFYKNYIDALSQSMNDVVFTDIKENEIEQSNGLEILCELSRDVKQKQN